MKACTTPEKFDFELPQGFRALLNPLLKLLLPFSQWPAGVFYACHYSKKKITGLITVQQYQEISKQKAIDSITKEETPRQEQKAQGE